MFLARARFLRLTRAACFAAVLPAFAACATVADTRPPTVDRGIAPVRVQGFGSGSGAFRVYLSAPDAMLILDLDPPPSPAGAVPLDVAAGLPSVRRVELATGAGREALLPSGPALPVPSTVVRVTAQAGTVFAERLGERGVKVAARGLVFTGGRSIDLAPRAVALGTFPPSVAVPPGK